MICSIDFETHLIQKGAIFPKPVCISYYNGTETGLLVKEDMFSFIKELLTGPDIIVAHNATFECGVIYYHFPELIPLLFKAIEDNRIVCTKIQEQTINVTAEKPSYSFALSDLVLKYLGKDITDTKTEDAWRLRYNELENVPLSDWPEEATEYAINDSIFAYEIFKKQQVVDGTLSLKSSIYLNLMASFGITIDKERVELLYNEILQYLNPRYEFLISEGYCSYDKNKKIKKNIKVLKEYIQTLDIEFKYTSKGTLALDGEALEFYMSQIDDKVIRSFSELAIYEKVVSAYIANMQEDISYTQYSTVKNTGRTSASKSALYPSMNIQQMPRQVPNVSYDVRNCFIPREGKKIVSIDYAGLELAATAHQLYKTYRKSAMADIINSGDKPTDLHSKLAAKIKGISYEEFLAKKKEYKDVRQLAKPINLGFPGGIGYDTMRHLLWRDGIKTRFNVIHKDVNKNNLKYYYFELRKECDSIRVARLNKNEWGLVDDELVKLKRDFYDLYPELEMFLKEGHKRFLTEDFKWMMNEYGEWEKEPMYKYEVYGFKRSYCTYTALCNGFLMQSPSAIGAKKAVNKIVRIFHDHPDIKPLAFIHDEILFECKEERKDLILEAANIMIEEMQSVLSSVRITVEASMSDYWQKADGFWTESVWRNAA